MRSLAKVRITPGGAGDALPVVFQALEQKKIRIRRGQVTLAAAPPNSGKSIWALYLAVRLVQKGLRVLYASADTDAHDQKLRAACMLSSHRYEDIEKAYVSGAGDVYYDEMLEALKGLKMDFKDAPTFEYLSDHLLAFNELWGEYPDLTVVDNLGNVVTDYEDEYRGLRDATKAFKHMARETGSAFLLLHHVNESENDPTTPAARKQITGKITQTVENAITLVLSDEEQVMRFASVKNRSGKKSASGNNYSEIHIDPDRCLFFASQAARDAGMAI